jgi:hypothetical protein
VKKEKLRIRQMEYEPVPSNSEMKISKKKVANFFAKLWESLGVEVTGSQG